MTTANDLLAQALIDPEIPRAMHILESGTAPKLYTLNLDTQDGIGGCAENGSVLCPECFGLWAPEHLARAVTHVERGACRKEQKENTAREVPLRMKNMTKVVQLPFVPQPFIPWGSWH